VLTRKAREESPSYGGLLVSQKNWRGKLLTMKSKSTYRDLPLPVESGIMPNRAMGAAFGFLLDDDRSSAF
jgi:hypothetical protein